MEDIEMSEEIMTSGVSMEIGDNGDNGDNGEPTGEEWEWEESERGKSSSKRTSEMAR
jgi:hypothetical protein